MSEASELEEGGTGEVPEVLLAGDHPRVTGFPPGNPNHISPEEAGLRKEETVKFGKDVAATRAWARATEHRAKTGGPQNPKNKGKGQATPKPGKPTQASDFRPMADGIKSAATGDKKKQLTSWSPKVQFASQLVAMKLERADFAFSEDEANLITEATIDLLDFYNVKIKRVGPWGGMAYAVLMVFGPRVATLVMERINANKPQGA